LNNNKKESFVKKIIITSLLISIITSFPVELIAGDEEPGVYKPTISGQWFMAYQHGEAGDQQINSFLVRRGYIILKSQSTHRIAQRKNYAGYLIR
jgi:hypothetical protein